MKKCRKCRRQRLVAAHPCAAFGVGFTTSCCRKAVYIGYGMRYCARCYARIYGVWED